VITPVEEKVEQPKSRERKAEDAQKQYTMQELFPAYDSLSDADKKLITDRFEGIIAGAIKWKGDFGLCTDPTCKNAITKKDSSSPYEISTCPNCGLKFK
jgi:hypothetical protein